MVNKSEKPERRGLPPRPEQVHLAPLVKPVNWKRITLIVLGLALFTVVHFSPAWPDAVDPGGVYVTLGPQAKDSIALFLLAFTWWAGEVVPIGVTGIVIGVIQALFLIRPAKAAFSDYLDVSVWFIIGSLVLGMVFTRTGLAQRMAYRMLLLAGERTRIIYLGCFAMMAMMTLLMYHTLVAAAIFPLLMAVHSLYQEDDKPTRFGKGLFVGMAFTAGAGSIVTLLGAARGPVAIGLFRDMTGKGISFSQLSYYMLPLGWGMVILLWLFCSVLYRPEKKTIPGLHERARTLHSKLGPMSRSQRLALTVTLFAIIALVLRSYIPVLESLDESAIILITTVLFFLLGILELKDLEEIPWNIVLLFGGAMSMGLCLWQTGAAKWLAINCLVLFQREHWVFFALAVSFSVLLMTNLIMNVAALAACLPVALVIAGRLGVAPEVILFSSLVAAGTPFLTVSGTAPNAIAFGSRQFTPGEFFAAGSLASLLLLAVLGLFVWVVWPLMGMPVLAR